MDHSSWTGSAMCASTRTDARALRQGNLRRVAFGGVFVVFLSALALLGRATVPPPPAPSPPEVTPVDVSVEQTIPPVPGTYPFEQKTQVIVEAEAAGWILSVRVSQLQSEQTDTVLDAGSVHLITDDGASVPLESFYPLVFGGPEGRTPVEFQLAAITDSPMPLGRYSGEIIYLSQSVPEGEPRTVAAPLIVEVVVQASHRIENHRMYFHFGNPAGETQAGIAEGCLRTDTPLCLSLVCAGGKPDQLPMNKAFGSVQPTDPGAFIPVQWSFGEGISGTLRRPDRVEADGDVLIWEVQGQPDTDIRYRLECELVPESYQAPGDYGKAYLIELRPRL